MEPIAMQKSRSCALALLLALPHAGCADDVVPIQVARCQVDEDCDRGEVCVDGRCVPRGALSCGEVDGGLAILQPTPPLLDFGFVGSGTARGQVILRNIGDCTLTIFDAYFKEDGIFGCPSCDPSRFPVELFPFREHELTVLFTPSGTGVFEDQLLLLSDDAEFPELPVPVRARFDGIPRLAVAPVELDFDFVPVGRSVTQTVRLTNQGSGSAPLLIEAVEVESATVATFSVAPLESAPVALSPSRTAAADGLDLTIQYRPAEIDLHRGSLVVRTNERGNSVVRVPLQGSSRTPASLSVSPEFVRLGPVPIGQTTSAPLTIVNEGGSSLRVTPRWGGTGLSTDLYVEPIVLPPIPPGGFGELQVFVTATTLGPITGLLVLESNDPRRPSVTVPVSAEGQDVVGAQVVRVEMTFENGSTSFFDDDFRNVDVILENPFGLLCNKQNPSPTNWGAFGNPGWVAFPPKEEPERIVLPDAMQDGRFRVLLNYVEDCASVPAGLVAAVLGISVEVLINSLTGGIGIGPDASDIARVVDNLCLSRRGTTALVTVSINGQLVAEVSRRLGARGELAHVLDLVRQGGQFTVEPR